MSKLFKDHCTLGVIISRMQVPYLTDSHINMIQTVQSRHNKVLILLGVTKCSSIDTKNPFSFMFRKKMIEPFLREFDLIMPIKDNEDNDGWVKNVDSLVESNLFVDETAVLYGGRDSFIPFYIKSAGTYETIELLPEDNDSGTELRNIAANKIPTYSRAVAEAIIYTINRLL